VCCSQGTTERWFHGNIDAHDAENLLLVRGSNGSYLVWSSIYSPGDMVLVIRKDNSHVINVRICNNVSGGLKFSCLSNLIDHYKEIPMKEINGEKN